MTKFILILQFNYKLILLLKSTATVIQAGKDPPLKLIIIAGPEYEEDNKSATSFQKPLSLWLWSSKLCPAIEEYYK